MKLKKINILGYRQFKNIEVTMDNQVTVIAGANNCGKTSLVELFNIIFNNGKITYNDLSVRQCMDWNNKIFDLACDIFAKKDNKNDHLTEIDKLIFSDTDDNDGISPLVIPPICIKIQIDYEDTDDIRNFSDYLMDLDLDKRNFFFVYEYAIDRDLFKKSIDKHYDKLFSRIKKYNNEKDKDKKESRKNETNIVLALIYSESLKEKTFYSDSSYKKLQSISLPVFKSLFNYCNIFANRILDDANTDKKRILSKNMVDIAVGQPEWDEKISQLPDQVLQPIQDSKIHEIIKKSSLKSLEKTIQEISKTNGGNTGNLSLEIDITEESIKNFINNVICTKYQLDDCQLSESSVLVPT